MLPNIKTDHTLQTAAASSQETKRLDNLDDHTTGRTLMQSPDKITPQKLRNPKGSQDSDVMVP